MAIKKQETNELQIGLNLFSKKRRNKTDDNKLCFLDSPIFKSLGSPPPIDEIIIIDDDEEEQVTLEPKKKKPRLGSWWDNVEPFDELSCVVKGSPEAKEDNDVVSRADSCFSSNDPHATKTNKKNDESITKNKGYEHVTLEDLGVSVEDLKSIPWEAFDPTWEIRSDPWLGGYMEDLASH